MEDTIKIRKDKIKNVALIFLSVMLILTFFSNSILNRALPEVATAYVAYNTITEKVRGNGVVTADDPYKVVVKDTRTIESVAVKVGDEVTKDQVLFYLEDAESEELKKAKDELEDLELAYMKAMFGSNLSSDVINKVANGKEDSFATYQAKVTDMQNRLQAAEDRVKECEKALETLSTEGSVNNNDASADTIPDELEKADAATDLANAEAEFNANKAKQVANINAQITEVQNQIKDLETLINKGQSLAGGSSSAGDGSSAGGSASSGTAYETAKANVESKLAQLIPLAGGSLSTDSTEEDAKNWYENFIDWEALSSEEQLEREAKYGEYRVAIDELNDIVATLGEYGSVDNRQEQLSNLKNQLTSLQAKLEEVNSISVSSSGSVQEAKNRLEKAEKNITEINAANKQSSVAHQNKVLNAELALKNAQTVYDLLKEEQTTLASDINAQLDLTKANKDIAEKKEEIAKLESESVGATIVAPVEGTIVSLEKVAGETTEKGEAIATIQVAGKGMSLSFSVTNAQAAKVNVGDKAELQNAWYYNDVMITLSNIKPDPEDPGKKKLLEFNVEGLVQNGESLSVSVGQRSAEYEHVVPNSAVREDNKGKFILIIDEKTTPFGNRYKARRVDVEVLASDEINTAVSADLQGYEYVITTSNQPVKEGDQVRLNG
ncbi:MAG: HlyD family efflux transporter periplasmic adaptor subunit [Lachnospiraceae bacterium]|nr:HlyD family efflux transporter periplasmic adaptor subunit [Lachnospiraceae bacterium]